MSISDAVLRFVIDDSNDQKSVVSYGLIVIGLSCAIVALLLPVLKLSVFGGLGNYSGYFLLMYVSTALMTYAGNVARGLNQIKNHTDMRIDLNTHHRYQRISFNRATGNRHSGIFHIC